MWRDLLAISCVSIFLVELGLLFYFALRRRWIMFAWLGGGLLVAAVLGGSIAAATMSPWASGQLATARAARGWSGGMGVFVTFATTAAASYVGAALGAILGGLIGGILGHLHERRTGRCPSRRPAAAIVPRC
ncbi:MAG: hypothetical protein CHACPFDD_00218 [Phycisphaerae bacterium]|nr:hypothetical protein [Phycisphaerae bacterium]